MSVDRYDVDHEGYMADTPNGDYVRYDSYALLKEKHDSLAAKLSMVNDLMKVAEHANKLAQEETEKLSNERKALAAENAGLKSAHPQPFGPDMMRALEAYEKHQDEVPETGMINAFFILRDSIRFGTPATDRFIADVKAQDSAPLVKALTTIANSEQHSGDTVVCDFDTLISVASGALRDYYAQQLREAK